MTADEHEAQRALVARSSMLADTTAERRGVYALRKPKLPPVVPVPLVRAFTFPVVRENEDWRPKP